MVARGHALAPRDDKTKDFDWVWLLSVAFFRAFVFMAAGRGRSFSMLDSLVLFVASAGPLVGAPIVAKVGFSGAFALCGAIYTLAACALLLAPPSPQPVARASTACHTWVVSSTPALLWRNLLRTRKLRGLCASFVLAMGGATGGASTVVYYGQRYLGWRQQQIGIFFGGFSMTGALLVMIVHPLVSWVSGRRVSDLTMVRYAYAGPVLYFALVAALPRKDGVWPPLELGAATTAPPPPRRGCAICRQRRWHARY